jgi:hypothetical protein
MESFEVKILHMRKRIGIREVAAPSIELAEFSIIQLLKQYFGFENLPVKIIYYNSTLCERKLKFITSDYNFFISLIKADPGRKQDLKLFDTVR